jgi:O-antigen/teichoic acid export membrane protein
VSSTNRTKEFSLRGAAVARDTGLNLTARVASGAAALALTVLTTNVLTTRGRGTYAILATSAGIAATIMTGSETLLAADLIHKRRTEPLLNGVSVAITAYCALCMVLLVGAITILQGPSMLGAMLYTAAVVAFTTYSNLVMYILQARGDVLRVSLTLVSMALFPLMTSAVAVVIFVPSVMTLMAAWAVGALVTALLQFGDRFRTCGVVSKLSGRVAAGVIRRSAGVSFSNAVTLLCTRIDVLVVAAVLSVSAAGIYSIPVALSINLLLLSRSLLTAAYHSIMTAPEAEVGARLGLALRHSVLVVSTVGLLSVPVIAVSAGAVFGEAYARIWVPYAILVPGSAFACVNEILRHFLLTRLERQRELVLACTGMLVANGVLAVLGAAAFGLPGAAASTTITYAGGAIGLVGVCAQSVSVKMRELAVPRFSDIMSYWRMLALIWAKVRLTRSVPRW